MLAGIVKRGSDTILRQQSELQRRLDQNLRLHQRVRRAAGRSTAVNEQALRRISADLHDGPGQVLALALLRLDALQTPCEDDAGCAGLTADFKTVHAAVRDALADLRAISAGLRLPQLEQLSIAEVAARAIDDHQGFCSTGSSVWVTPSPPKFNHMAKPLYASTLFVVAAMCSLS